MTQEEKMLLIKDLSARLPYAVTVEHTSGFRGTLHDITVHHMYDDNDDVHDAVCYTDFFGDEDSIYIEYFKPYLFPLSSMTEEQEKEEYEICKEYIIGYESNLIDFYNKYHLDYRGLIPKGLAIDATGKNIY
jgi:hypothetical protein